MELAGRCALVTGASQGIGRAIALAFAEAGADVVVTARSGARLETLTKEIRGLGRVAIPITADMAAAKDIERLASDAQKAFEAVDVLVNNAGIIHPPIEVVDFDPDLWRRVIDVNLTGAFLLTQALLPAMINQGSGKVINISSIGGRGGGARRSAYRATKAALISFTQSLAAEVKSHGIDVNAICPGGVRTEGFVDAFGEESVNRPGMMAPEEIARVAVFLASDASTAVTGTAIDAFGGTNPLFS